MVKLLNLSIKERLRDHRASWFVALCLLATGAVVKEAIIVEGLLRSDCRLGFSWDWIGFAQLWLLLDYDRSDLVLRLWLSNLSYYLRHPWLRSSYWRFEL